MHNIKKKMYSILLSIKKSFYAYNCEVMSFKPPFGRRRDKKGCAVHLSLFGKRMIDVKHTALNPLKARHVQMFSENRVILALVVLSQYTLHG